MVVLLRGRRKAMELPKTVLEIALEKTKAIRDGTIRGGALRLLEMAVRSVQWKELERLELCKLWLGVETCWPRSRCSADPAGARHGRGPRHGDASQQPVPDRDDESRSLDNSDTKSSTDRSEAGLSFGKTNASPKSIRDGAKNARHRETEDGGNNERNGAGKRSGGKRKEESWTSDRSGVGRCDTPGHAETALEYAIGERSRPGGENRGRHEGGEDGRREHQGGNEERGTWRNPADAAGQTNVGRSGNCFAVAGNGGHEEGRRGRRRKIEESKNRSRKVRKHCSSHSCRKPQQCSQQHQRAEAGSSDDHDCTIVLIYLPYESGGQNHDDHDRQGNHRGGPGRCDGDGNPQAGDWVRLVRTGRDDEDQYSQGGSRPFQAVLNHEKEAKAKSSGRMLLRGPKARNRMEPERQGSGERKPREFDSTLGYPGEGPQRVQDFGINEKCSECVLVPWRVSRGGDAGKCEKCKNVRKRGTEMMKCRVCAWRVCATCHNMAMRGETAQSPPEMRQPGRDEDEDATQDADGVDAEDEMSRSDETQRTLESLRRLAERNVPNTSTFIPHRLRKRFARIYSAKINELSFHMRVGVDTPKREMLNLLVWAIPALILSEDDTSTELHKEHHSKAAGLNQRLAEAERDEWTNLIERAQRKQQEEEEKRNQCPNQLEDKEQAYLRRVNRAIFKANNGCLRAAKQILMEEHKPLPVKKRQK